MKVFAISDLHLSFETDKPMDVFGEKWENYEEKIKANVNNKVSSDDVLIIAGDISWAMKQEETKSDFNYLGELSGKKLIVRGNHDYWWKSISNIRDVLKQHNAYALQNDSIKIGDYVFCGTRGWIVPEHGKGLGEEDQKIYDRELLRLQMALSDAKRKMQAGDKLVVIMHFPPFNSDSEDSDFTKLMDEFNVNFCVYGHIHGYSKFPVEPITKNKTKYFLSSCDKIHFDPIEII